jgi:hypothetical protein
MPAAPDAIFGIKLSIKQRFVCLVLSYLIVKTENKKEAISRTIQQCLAFFLYREFLLTTKKISGQQKGPISFIKILVGNKRIPQ